MACSPLQAECPDPRHTHAHLKQGTRLSKKLTNNIDLKHYLNVATIASDGLLVVKRDEPLVPTRECIIVPRNVLGGLVSALHVYLSHPCSRQLKSVTQRYLLPSIWTKPLIAFPLAAIIVLYSAQFPLLWQSSLLILHLKLWVSPLLLTSSNEPNSLSLFWVNTSLPIQYLSTLLPNERHNTLRDAVISL